MLLLVLPYLRWIGCWGRGEAEVRRRVEGRGSMGAA